MTNKEILEGNTSILEFLGYTIKGNYTKYVFTAEIPNGLPHDTDAYHNCDSMKFNSSWDWLMPVVDIVKKTHAVIIEYNDGNLATTTIFRFDGNDLKKPFIQVDDKDLLFTVYTSIIKFIKWYNDNNKK